MNFARKCMTAAVGTLNSGGRALQRFGIDAPALEAQSLIRTARRRTGLEAFGDWAFEEPLERLLRSYVDEARLTTLGRVTVREMIVSLLENLLQLEHDRRANPAIAQQVVEAPTFIIGLPRTGTTHLHGLMSHDPANRAPLSWEVMYPAGYPNTAEGIEATRKRTASRLAWANQLAPGFKRIHPIAPDLPQECIAITAQVFMSIQFHTTHHVPTYEDWFERESQQLAYRHHHRFLQHLQARESGRRWVLKAPGHLFALGALLARYPEAKIIQTHRDPLRVMASMASHATTLRRAFSNAAIPSEIATDWTNRWARALDNFLETRDHAPAAQFLDVGYQDIENKPEATLERVYDFLGWPLSPEAKSAMQDFLKRNPKNKHGVHRYSLEQYGLDRDKERARFRSYCERFAIPTSLDVV